MKKYLKLIKGEESYDIWKDSDEAGYPHVAMYEVNHPEVTSGESIIFEKSTEKPKPTITFTIDGTEYQAKEGMTWGEWIDSEYNVINASIYMLSSGVGHIMLGEQQGMPVILSNSNGDYVDTTQEIITNHNYTAMGMGGGGY